MARFKRPSGSDAIHADWWDEGTLPDGSPWREEVILKPNLTFGTQQRATKASLNPPDNISIDQFQAATPMQMFKWTDQERMNRVLLEEQVIKWSFRYEPTPEQEAAGEPGDLRPFTPSAIEELDPDDVQYIIEQINNRTGGRRKAAEEAKPEFRPDIPVDPTLEGGEGL